MPGILPTSRANNPLRASLQPQERMRRRGDTRSFTNTLTALRQVATTTGTNFSRCFPIARPNNFRLSLFGRLTGSDGTGKKSRSTNTGARNTASGWNTSLKTWEKGRKASFWKAFWKGWPNTTACSSVKISGAETVRTPRNANSRAGVSLWAISWTRIITLSWIRSGPRW